MDVITGYLGDFVLAKGTPEASHSVDQGLYRFRRLNRSDVRIFKVGFAHGHPFHLIATDGELLPAPVQVTRAMLAPGQRLECPVDFSSYAVGGSVPVKNLSFPPAEWAD